MISTTLNNIEYLMVEVPKDAYDVFIGYFSGGLCYRGGDTKPLQEIINLPSGTWQIIGKASELTEEDWKVMVDYYPSVFSDGGFIYHNYESDIPKKRTATSSGHSWIRSLGMDVDKCLILKKN